MKRTIATLVIGGGWLCSALSATPHKIECPPEIPAPAVTIKAPDGWTSYASQGIQLRAAEPMLGPPSEMGFLKPSRTVTTKAGSVDSWAELEGNSLGGKWIACRYGERGEIILAKPLSNQTSACTVSRLHNKLEISCSW